MKTKTVVALLALGLSTAGITLWAAAVPTPDTYRVADNTTTSPRPTAPVTPIKTATTPTPLTPAKSLAHESIINSSENIKDTIQLESKTPEYVILQPIDEATFSSETTASVESLPVKEGSYFKMGDTLLVLDCRVQKAEYQKALAQQTATSVALKSAQRLKSYDSISEFEVIKARSEAAMVDADVSKLGAIVDKCVIKAPFNGAVSDLNVHTHDTVKPGDPLIKIVNTDHLIVELEVPSDWLQWLHIGSNFNVQVNEINQSIIAKVVRINPQIEPVSQTVKIVGEIVDISHKLLPGMSGQASFPDDPSKKNVKRLK